MTCSKSQNQFISEPRLEPRCPDSQSRVLSPNHVPKRKRPLSSLLAQILYDSLTWLLLSPFCYDNLN